MTDMTRIVAFNNPIGSEPVETFVDSGQTIGELFPDLSEQVKVSVNGNPLHEEYHGCHTLEGGDLVTMIRMPAGDSDEGKAIGRSALILSMQIAAAVATQGASVAWQVGAQAAATVGGSIAANQVGLVPTPDIRNTEPNTTEFNQRHGLTGSRNRLAPYAVVPRVYGKHRIYPPMSANPYTEINANVQYMRLLFNLGDGPLQLSDPKIGETSIGSFDSDNNFTPNGNYEDVRIQVAEQPSLYSKDINEANPDVDLNNKDDSAIRTTVQDTDEASLDFTFPRGLFFTGQNATEKANVDVQIDYRNTPDDFGTSDVDPAADTITIAGHGYSNGHVVQFSTTGTLPAGLSAGTDYYIINRTADTLQVSTVQGGSAVDITDSGTGTHTITQSWVNALEDNTIIVGYLKGDPITDTQNFFRMESAAKETYWAGINVELPRSGQYDFRVTRLNIAGGTNLIDQCVWSSFRSVKHEKPTNIPGTVQLAMKIKATDQLNGVIDNFSVVAESRLSYYDGTQWDHPTFDPDTGTGTGGKLTSSPAWILADLFCGDMNQAAVAYSELDAAGFKYWDDNFGTEFQYNSVIDSDVTVKKLADNIASAGRASWGIQDGVYTPILDEANQSPVQMFTPRNSADFNASKEFPEELHGLKMKFRNADNGWQEDEAIVYQDGYSEDGTDCLFDDGTGICKKATKFQEVKLDGVTSWAQAWKLGRYKLAERILRPEIYKYKTDVEYLRCQRGDVVFMASDVTLWGSTWGRVKGITRNVSNEITNLTLDQKVLMQSGKNYNIRVRLQDGSFALLSVQTDTTETNQVTIDVPQVADVNAGDLFAFGEDGGEAVPLKVIDIRPGNDLSATLTLVDEADAIHSADDGTIPAYNSQITTPTNFDDTTPAAPTIDNIRSDDSTLYKDEDGTFRLRILVSFILPESPVTEVEARYRAQDSPSGWAGKFKTDASSGVVALPDVERGKTYIIQVRAMYKNNVSEWVGDIQHTVKGKENSPSTLTTYNVVIDKTQLRHSWNDPTDKDIEKFELRRGADWETGTFIDRTKGTTLTSDIPGDGTYTYWIKAIDTSGNYSGSAISSSVTIDSKYTSDPAYPGDDSYMETDFSNVSSWSSPDSRYVKPDTEPSLLQVQLTNAPSLQSHAATKNYVDSAINGLDWQESVIDQLNDPSTITPSEGDRYLVGTSPVGDFSGHSNEISVYDGSSWSFITPDDGTAMEIEAAGSEGEFWIWNSTSWVKFGSAIDHGVLQGLDDDDHPQYMHTNINRTVNARHTFEDGFLLGNNTSVESKDLTGYDWISEGYGLKRESDGDVTQVVDNLSVRKYAKFRELLFEDIQVFAKFLLNEGNKVDRIEQVGDGSWSWSDTTIQPFQPGATNPDGVPYAFANQYRCYVAEDTRVQLEVDDLVLQQQYSGQSVGRIEAVVIDVENGAADVTDNSTPRYFTISVYSGGAPQPGMTFARLGNRTNTNRQGGIYFAGSGDYAPYKFMYDGVDSFAKFGTEETIVSFEGNTEGRVFSQFDDLDGTQGQYYSTVMKNAHIEGRLVAGVGSDVDWSFIKNVVVENADIKDAAITDAKIANLNVDKLEGQTINADLIDSDEVIAGAAEIGGLNIDDTRLYSDPVNGVVPMEIIGAGNSPGLHLRGENDEDMWIGGDFSYDSQPDENIADTDFTYDPSRTEIGSSLVSASADQNDSQDSDRYPNVGYQEATYTFNTAWNGRMVRFSMDYTLSETTNSATDINGNPVSSSANADVEFIFEILDSADNVVASQSLTRSGNKTGTFQATLLLPNDTDTYSLRLRYYVYAQATAQSYTALNGSTAWLNASASSEVTSPDATPLAVLGIKEFMSPLGASWYNEASLSATPERVLIDRNDGEVLGHKLTIESSEAGGDQAWFVVEGGELKLKNDSGNTVWSQPL